MKASRSVQVGSADRKLKGKWNKQQKPPKPKAAAIRARGETKT